MTDIVQFPLTSLDLRSLVTEDASLRLFLKEVEITQPEADEVVVRIEGAPVNPSDLGLMLGGIPADSFAPCGDGSSPALSAPLPPAAVARLAERTGQPLPVGLEGMGTVIAAGPDADHLLGRKVAMVGYGNYAQFRKIAAGSCLLLHDDTKPESGAGAFVNPMTSSSMVEAMRREGHSALVHTAAASNLGQMLVKICQADGIGLVNIVRSEEQVQLLKGLGAEFVCNTSSPDFDDELLEAVRKTGATLAFDAVGGGDLASRILSAMEKAAKTGEAPYSRYGSDRHKQVYIYGGFDPSPIILRKDYGMAWGVGGWLLFPFLEKIGADATERLKARILSELDTVFASHFGQSISLHQLLEPETLTAAGARSTGGKFLVKPHHGPADAG